MLLAALTILASPSLWLMLLRWAMVVSWFSLVFVVVIHVLVIQKHVQRISVEMTAIGTTMALLVDRLRPGTSVELHPPLVPDDAPEGELGSG